MKSPKKRKVESELEQEMQNDGNDEVFVVQRILAQMVEDGQTKYLVKWQDCRDDESTWEPAENFENEDTLEEWKKQLASGDTLDASEVAALELRIGQRLQDQLEEEVQEKSEQLQRREASENGTELESSQRSPRHLDPSENGKQKSRIDPAVQAKTSEGVRAAKSLQAHGVGSYTPASTVNGEQPKFYGIKSFKKTRPSRPTGSIKSKKTGEKFKNGRHMNNARKKARDETAHVMNANVKPIAGWTEDSSLNARPSLTSVEPHYGKDDSPLFFPDLTGTSSPKTTEPPGDFEQSRTWSSFSSVGSITATLGEEVQVQVIAAKPKSSSSKSFQTLTGPRVVGLGDILVHLRFGQHPVGDVLVIHYPPWLKTKIVRLKQKGEHVLPVHFQEDLVFNDVEFANVTAYWPPTTASVGAVKPFADTEAAVNNLAKHLAENNLVAIWEYPDPSETIALILYSPRAKSWCRYAQDPRFRRFSLIMEARNRAPQGAKADPIQRPANPVSMSDHQERKPSTLVEQAQPDRPPPTLGLSNRRLIIDTARLKAASSISPKTPIETHISKSVAPTDEPRRRSAPSPRIPAPSLACNDLGIKETRTASSAANNTANDEKPLSKTSGLDWSVAKDFQSLTKETKPLVYIAFAHHYPPKAAEALKEWAAKHTSSRFVFIDINGESEWDDFRETKSPALLLFNEKSPSFGMLRDLWQVLTRDNSFCYNVKLTEPTRSTPAKYRFSKVFPRGTVLLITERTIVNHTKEAEFVMMWFKNHAKPGPWKIMLRPNVRSWLQHTAINCKDNSNQTLLFNIFGWLYRLGPNRDVTVGDDKGDQLGALEMSTESEDDFIVPLPLLSDYDDSPGAANGSAEVSRRDSRLLDHFIYWSVMEASNISRRFIVIDDLEGEKDQGVSRRKEAGHIRFWSPRNFMQTLQKA